MRVKEYSCGHRGDTVRALVAATSMTPANAEIAVREGILPRIDYLALAEHLPAEYVDYNAVPDRSAGLRQLEIRLCLDVGEARHVARLVRERGYDLVFSMSERVGIPLALLLPDTVCHVVFGHHLLSPRKLRPLRGLHVSQRWDRVLVPTRAERDRLRRAWPDAPHQIEWLPNSVDTRFFRPDGAAASSGEGLYVLSAGLSYRDYPTLIAALRRLPEITAHLHVGSMWSGAGSGPITSLPDNVQRKPFIALPALRACYQASRFVVLPLRCTTLLSAGSTVALQAQAMGKPVIATRTPGMEEYIQDGVTGLLVEPEDPHALAAAIAALWNDPARVDAMGRRAREWVVANFGFDQWLECVAALLRGHEASEVRDLIYA